MSKEHLRLQAAHGREGGDFVPPFDLGLMLLQSRPLGTRHEPHLVAFRFLDA